MPWPRMEPCGSQDQTEDQNPSDWRNPLWSPRPRQDDGRTRVTPLARNTARLRDGSRNWQAPRRDRIGGLYGRRFRTLRARHENHRSDFHPRSPEAKDDHPLRPAPCVFAFPPGSSPATTSRPAAPPRVPRQSTREQPAGLRARRLAERPQPGPIRAPRVARNSGYSRARRRASRRQEDRCKTPLPPQRER